MSAEMAAESGAQGESAAEAVNGYAPHQADSEPSNGAAAGAVVSVEPTDAPTEGDDSVTPSNHTVRHRSATEKKLITRGRQLLHSYRQMKCDKRDLFSEFRVCESSAVELVKRPHKRDDRGDANGFTANGAPAAVASVDSNENWLGKSSVGREEIQRQDVAQLQDESGQLLTSMEQQLEKLWEELRDEAKQKASVDVLRQSISQLMERKRKAEASLSIATRTAVSNTSEQLLTSNPTPPQNCDSTQLPGLHIELQEAKTLISKLSQKVNSYKSQLAALNARSKPTSENGHSNGMASDDVRKLQIRVLEKEELLLSLRNSLEYVVQDHGKLEQELRKARSLIERLEGEKAQMEKAASDKRCLLHRAYVVKAKQLDQLCKDIELPPSWERVTDENGIIYYRQNDRACAPELEDPRVALALERFSPASIAPSSSPRSATARMEHTPHTSKPLDRKFSSSSFDSTVSCEDISIPPDDGMKHEVQDFETPLPEGWEMRVTTGGSVFFVNRVTNVTTWKDPRSLKPFSTPADSLISPSSNLHLDITRDRSSTNEALTINPSNSEAVTDVNHPSRRFDVVFEDKGPIGIHFQANTPDSGATVRRLLPRMAAARTQSIEPYDRLIAVNKNPVGDAPFRHVMLLLQGGLRPLTLTFEREAMQTRSRQPSGAEHQFLDEEVVVDEEEPSHREHALRQPHSTSVGANGEQPSASRSQTGDEEEELTVADRIITNLFSLFWTPPEPPRSQVETV